MGRSITINCIGETEIKEGKSSIYTAMNRLEVEQENIKAVRRRNPILWWYAQTKTGEKILGISSEINRWTVTPEELSKIKTVPCPKCSHLDKPGCGICNFSGITTKRHLKGYREWQLEPLNN